MYLNDMWINMEIEIPEAIIDKESMLSFAKRYDSIPLHTDEEYAKNTKFGQIIAPGVMSFMAVWAKYLEVDVFGEELVAGKSTRIEWYKPVYADDVLKGKAVLTNVTRRNPYNGIAELTIEVFNQHGEHVLSNVTEAIVKYRTS